MEPTSLSGFPTTCKASFRGRKGTTTQNVLVVVDFDMRFTYVLAGWEGSAHDTLVLADALERNDGLWVPQVTMFTLCTYMHTKPPRSLM
jgi:hypothetical protein